jgi:putative FMN-dependent luciferase-like monooxygenase
MTELSFFTRLLDDVPPGERFRLALEQIEHAEAHGYGRAWVAQHHFRYVEGGLPSPFVFLAHAAARIPRIRLATGIVTLTLEDPLRVAEDAVVADLLSGGRIDLGVGSGARPESFVPFGLDAANKGADYAVKLDRLHAALNGDDLGAENHLYPGGEGIRNRIWQATFSPYGGTSAGENGNALLLSKSQPRTPELAGATLADIQLPIITAYREALAEATAPRVTASRAVFVADTTAEALAFAEAGLERLRAFADRNGRRLDLRSPDAIAATSDTFIGDPDDVARLLAADETLRGVDEVAVQVHSVDPPHEHILRSLELVAAEVAPRLGWATSDHSVPVP